MNMQKMLKRVQKMQADMAKTQEELKTKTVDATAGGRVPLPLLPTEFKRLLLLKLPQTRSIR